MYTIEKLGWLASSLLKKEKCVGFLISVWFQTFKNTVDSCQSNIIDPLYFHNKKQNKTKKQQGVMFVGDMLVCSSQIKTRC